MLDAYTEAQARTLDTAADDDQRRMLQELADKMLASLNEVVERRRAAQRQYWYEHVTDQRIAAMNADTSPHWNSEALLRRALGTARAEVRERAERKDWDSPLTEAALSRERPALRLKPTNYLTTTSRVMSTRKFERTSSISIQQAVEPLRDTEERGMA